MDIENKIKELEAEIKRLKSINFPQRNDRYYYISTGGEVYCEIWEGFDVLLDNARLSYCNVFKTREEAEVVAKGRRLIIAIKKWREENDPNYLKLDWNDVRSDKFYMAYNHTEKEWDIHSALAFQLPGVIYFSSKEITKKALNHFELPLNKSNLLGGN